MYNQQQFVIKDMGKLEPRPQVMGVIVSDEEAISIHFDGFGRWQVDETESSPIFVELRDGELACYVMRNGWDKEPVKVVLSGARITKEITK